jgi:fucose 4-O-acetylase-like acetyltransferase
VARERDLRLDVLKAVAIALVVLGHLIRAAYGEATSAPWPLAAAFSVLSILDVPLFVFVSGYLASPTADARWLSRRALQLLVPYFAWIALRWALYYRTDPLGWLRSSVLWGNETNALWFLYALFAVCALYVLVRRWRPVMIGAAIVCVGVLAAAVPLFSLRYIAMLFPVFVVGRLVGERRFEPGPWALAVTAVLIAAMWSVPGANLLFAWPGWAAGAIAGGGWAGGAVAAFATVLRLALMLALAGSAMFLARPATRGAWLGALTLGVYAAHPILVPQWARGGGMTGLIGGFVVTMAAAVGVTLLLQRWEWTSFLLLGSGAVPGRTSPTRTD